MIKALAKSRVRYIVDWDSVYLENGRHSSFRDPFQTYDEKVAAFIEEICSAVPMPARTMRRRLP